MWQSMPLDNYFKMWAKVQNPLHVTFLACILLITFRQQTRYFPKRQLETLGDFTVCRTNYMRNSVIRSDQVTFFFLNKNCEVLYLKEEKKSKNIAQPWHNWKNNSCRCQGNDNPLKSFWWEREAVLQTSSAKRFQTETWCWRSRDAGGEGW